MNIRRTLAALVLVGLVLLAAPLTHWACTSALAGSQDVHVYTLFGGGTADSTEQASFWVPVQNANRVYIRTWSTGASTDTSFCDTITTFKVLLSDSVCCTVAGAYSGSTASAADSVVITGNAADSTKMVGVIGAPQGTAKIIRASASGSGLWTVIFPTSTPGAVPALPTNGANPNDVILPKYLRVRYTPRTRLTTAGFSSTQGIRTTGIKGLRMTATVVYWNK